MNMLREELKNIPVSPREHKKFAFLIGGIFIAGAWYYYRQGVSWSVDFLVVGSVLIILGIAYPAPLAGLYRGWMGIAVAAGFVVSKIVLAVVYFLVLTPIGIVSRLFGKHFLDLKIEKNAPTYWRVHAENGKESRERMERQF